MTKSSILTLVLLMHSTVAPCMETPGSIEKRLSECHSEEPSSKKPKVAVGPILLQELEKWEQEIAHDAVRIVEKESRAFFTSIKEIIELTLVGGEDYDCENLHEFMKEAKKHNQLLEQDIQREESAIKPVLNNLAMEEHFECMILLYKDKRHYHKKRTEALETTLKHKIRNYLIEQISNLTEENLLHHNLTEAKEMLSTAKK